ncbi:S41 family peptidase [Parahaliea mediterranea]|uniref:S41 family peptidase n=1 Tax=Parahaliea mediterranea TaxID=651086 RepID=A0A939ILV6_9GAMM|nr:S41 family peptidase [Parahaliea mediterranea]MBN7798781.1 S41 family peptidase [Parahaliea mediterranea]
MRAPSVTRSLLGAVLLSLPLASPAAVEDEPLLPLDELRTFADVYNQIRVGYVEEIDDSTLLEYAIQGMLMSLDPHSVYLTKDAFEDLQSNTSGEFSGLGLEVGMEDGYVKIIAPIDGSPAAEAGLLSGDVILKLDDNPVKGMSLADSIEIMRGPKGSEIVLTIGRPGESQPFEVTLVRDTIKVASVRQRILEPGYGYIRIAQFQTHTGEDVGEALQKLRAEGELDGLVLDLRNNPGGVLRSSVDVADLFMDGGLVVYTEGRLANSDMRYEARAVDASEGIPIVVLINGGSASASEIVAGALQDHGRAVIMGTNSFGKGSVQTVLPISESRAVKLTTALYFTPNGRSIQASGIAPDIVVERARVEAYDTSRQLSEADLSGHLENANGEASHERSTVNGLLSSDNQLYEALTLLKGVNILGMRDRQKQQRNARTAAASDS